MILLSKVNGKWRTLGDSSSNVSEEQITQIVNEKLTPVIEEQNNLKSSVDSITPKVTELESWKTNTDTTVTSNTDRIQSLENSLSGEGSITSEVTNINNLLGVKEDGTSTVVDTLSALETTVGKSSPAGEETGLVKRVINLEDTLNGVDATPGLVDNVGKFTPGEETGLVKEVRDLASDVNDEANGLRTKVDNVSTQLSTLESEMQNADEEIKSAIGFNKTDNGITTDITVLNTLLNVSKDEYGKSSSEVLDSLKSDITSLRTDVGSSGENGSGLLKEVETLKAESTQNAENISNLEKLVDGTDSEGNPTGIKKEVSEIQKLINGDGTEDGLAAKVNKNTEDIAGIKNESDPNSLTFKVNTLMVDVNGDESGENKGLKYSTQQLESKVTSLDTIVKELTRDEEGNPVSLDAVNADLKVLKNTINGFTNEEGEEVDGLSTKVNNLDDAINNPANGIKTTVTDNTNKISSLKEIVGSDGSDTDGVKSGLVKEVEDLRNSVNGTSGSSSLNDRIVDNSDRIQKLETIVGEEANEEESTESSGLVKRVEDLESAKSTITSDIEALQTDIGDDTSGLKHEVKTLKDAVLTEDGIKNIVGDSNSGLVKEVSDLQDKIASLESTEEDGLTGRVSTLETKVGDDSSGLVKEVNSLTTNFSTLNTNVGTFTKGAETGLVKEVRDLQTNVTEVQDKISGENGLESKIETLRSDLDEAIDDSKENSLANQIKNLNDRIDSVTGSTGSGDNVISISDIAKDVTSLKDAVGSSKSEDAESTGLFKDIEDLSSSIGTLPDNKTVIEVTDDLQSQIISIKDSSNADSLAGKLKKLQEQVGSDAEGSESGLEKDVVDINKRLDSIDGTGADSLKTQIESLTTAISGSEEGGSGLSGSITEINNILGDDNSGLRKQVSDNTSNIATITSEIGTDTTSGVKKRVADLENKVNGNEDTDSLETQINNLNEKITNEILNTTSDTSLAKKVSTLETSVGTYNGESDISTELASLQNVVNGTEEGNSLQEQITEINTVLGETDDSGIKKEIKELNTVVNGDDHTGVIGLVNVVGHGEDGDTPATGLVKEVNNRIKIAGSRGSLEGYETVTVAPITAANGSHPINIESADTTLVKISNTPVTIKVTPSTDETACSVKILVLQNSVATAASILDTSLGENASITWANGNEQPSFGDAAGGTLIVILHFIAGTVIASTYHNSES